DLAGGAARHQLGGALGRRDLEAHDVGLDGGEVEGEAGQGHQALGEGPRGGVRRPTRGGGGRRPAAAPPPCRIPPPIILRTRRACAMTSREPQISEPTGAPRPFDRQKVTESTWRVNSSAGRLRATAALKIRAPSRCTGTPAAWAASATAAISSGVAQAEVG